VKKFKVKINNNEYLVEVEPIDEPAPKKRKINISAFNFEDSAEKAGDGKKDDPNMVYASLPGNIIKILRKEGDQLTKNNPVLIMEAMKMENEILTPKDGKIKKIYVAPGQKVNKDDLLFEIEQ